MSNVVRFHGPQFEQDALHRHEAMKGLRVLLYEFQSDDGRVIEEHFSMKDAPDLGAPIVRDGTTYRRILSTTAKVNIPAGFSQFPMISSALPRYCEGADHVTAGLAAGKPIITSRSHQAELCRRYGFTREYD